MRAMFPAPPRGNARRGTGQAVDGRAAVDDHALAGDPGRVRAEQERGQLGGVGGQAQPLQRVGRRGAGLVALPQRLGEVGLHHRRRHRVHPHRRPHLLGQLAGEVDQRGLGGVVGTDHRAVADPADAGDVEDRAAACVPSRRASTAAPSRGRRPRSPRRSCARRRGRRRPAAPNCGFTAALFTSTSTWPNCRHRARRRSPPGARRRRRTRGWCPPARARGLASSRCAAAASSSGLRAVRVTTAPRPSSSSAMP